MKELFMLRGLFADCSLIVRSSCIFPVSFLYPSYI